VAGLEWLGKIMSLQVRIGVYPLFMTRHWSNPEATACVLIVDDKPAIVRIGVRRTEREIWKYFLLLALEKHSK
jgi:hypothetical protein